MRKKIVLFLVAIIGFIGFVNGVNAVELECDYKKTNPKFDAYNEFYNIHLSIDNYGYEATEIWYTTVYNVDDKEYIKQNVTSQYKVTAETGYDIKEGGCPAMLKVTGNNLELINIQNGVKVNVLSNVAYSASPKYLKCEYKKYYSSESSKEYYVGLQSNDKLEIFNEEDKKINNYYFKTKELDENGEFTDLTAADFISTFGETTCPVSLSLLRQSNGDHYVFFSESYKNYYFLNNSASSEKYCTEHLIKEECKKNDCVWVENENATNGGYCNLNNLQYVKCGGAYDIPKEAPQLISFLVYLLQIATPIILIIVGLITLVKAVAASKEDEIKKAQSSLIKKIIAAALVFFVIAIVKFVISMFADSVTIQKNGETEASNVSTCLDCLLSGDCDKNIYYISNISGTEMCTLLDGTTNTCENFYKKK